MVQSDSPDRALSPVGRFWRVVVVLVGLAILSYGQIADTNDIFPLGSLSQYGMGRDPNGSVTSFHVEADDAAGRRVRVPLNSRGVGVGRADIESQIARIRQDPSLLQGLADAWAGLHPDEPRYTTLYLMRSTRKLRDGKAVGDAEVTEVTSWQVR